MKIKSIFAVSLLLLHATLTWAAELIDGVWYILDDSQNTAKVTYHIPLYQNITPEYNTDSVFIHSSVQKSGKTYNVTAIAERAFQQCPIKYVSIPSSIKEIGKYAFSTCNKLDGVNITDVASWCKIFFGDVSSNPLTQAHKLYLNGALVTNLVIPDGVTTIYSYAFDACYSLSSVLFPSSLTGISPFAFSSCKNITSIVLPNGIGIINNYVFYGCSSLVSINIPNTVTSIKISSFEGCSALTSINLPNSLTTIDDRAFRDCSSLSSIIIPANVRFIGQESFYRCTNLHSIEVKRQSPAELEAGAFSNTHSNLEIIVPCGCLQSYQTADIWKNYSSRIHYGSSKVEAISSDVTKGTVSYPRTICDSPQIIATPKDGYHFTQWSDGNTDNPRIIDPTEDITYIAQFDINVYQVQFFGFNDVLLSKQSVNHGSSAKAPEVPNIENYEFKGWDKEFSMVVSDFDIHAIYEQKPNGIDDVYTECNTLSKELINGQLLILLPNGSHYTATGVKVE